MLLTTTLLVKNSQFKGNIVIGNVAYQLALTFREAQAYGVNVRGVDNPSADPSKPYIYTTPYGVHFDSTQDSSYLLFGDTLPAAAQGSSAMGDRKYTSEFGTADVLVRTYQMPFGSTVLKFCTKKALQDPVCGGGGASEISWLDVTFLRPQLSAAIRDSSRPELPASERYADSAVVFVKNTQGVCKAVKVTKVGQVTVVEDPKTLTDGYGEKVSGLCL